MDYKLFGCKVNKYYLTKRVQYFQTYNVLDTNAVLIATCVVTDKAKRKWIKDILPLLEDKKNIYLTGCGAFEKGDAMDRKKFFSLYPELEPYAQHITLLPEDPSSYDAAATSARPPTPLTIRKFIVIQSGCDSFCSFCLTVHKRGPHRSRTAADIIDEIKAYEDIGGTEIILTGVNLAAWGAPSTRNPEHNEFASLLQQIIAQTKIQRIRISSLGPEFLDDAFFATICNKRFLPYFHLSIQSFSTDVLHNMRRNYSTQTLENVLSRFRSLERDDVQHINIGADIIVGFPGETESAFQETYHGIKTYDITQLHAFPFSDHHIGEPVPASVLPKQISPVIKKFRAQQLKELGTKLQQDFYTRHIGTSLSAVIEHKKNNKRTGWTNNYIPIALEGDFASRQIVDVVLDKQMIVY